MYKIFLALLLPFSIAAQTGKRDLPSVDLKTLDGNNINTSSFVNDGKPIVISFWATWCKPCINELTNMAELYDEWKEETGVRIIAISVDDARNQSKVMPFINGKGWEFDVYLDPNADFKRALNVNLIPHTFLLDGNNQIIWQHNSYAEGDELKLFERIKQVAAGIPVSIEK